MLRATKPLTNVCGVLMLWYHYTTTPSVLMEIVQLYGGAYKDMMSEYHVDIFAQSMSDTDEKRVKVTLKIVKRIVSKGHAWVDIFISIFKVSLSKSTQYFRRLL